MDDDRVHEGLTAAVTGGLNRGDTAAHNLCLACVELLDIDAAALTIMHDVTTSGLLAASNLLGRELDELQFTMGQGPGLDALRGSGPVSVASMDDVGARRWPSFAGAATRRGIRAVLALPVAVAGFPIGVLTFSRTRSGPFEADVLAGGLVAAELAALPVLDLMGIDLDEAATDEASTAWEELACLTRVEVYQASGMLIAQLGVSPSEALIRLRGYAFAHDKSASEVAFEILDRRLQLGED